MENSLSDQSIIAALAQGSEQAFKEIYFRYKDKLWYYCFSFLKSEEDANDMVQDIFIRIWELRSSLNPERSFSSFIYTITRNRILNYFRDISVEQQVKKALSLKAPTDIETIESDLIFSDYQQLLKDAIEQLSPQRKKVFNMSRFDNLSHKEIAARLSISEYTVQEHISGSLHFIKDYVLRHTGLTISIITSILVLGRPL